MRYLSVNPKISYSRDRLERKALSFFPVLFYVFNFFRMAGGSYLPYFAVLAAGGMAGWILYLKSQEPDRMFLLFSVMYLGGALINMLLIGNLSVTDLLQHVLLFGITWLMCSRPFDFFGGCVVFGVTALFFSVHCLKGTNNTTLLSSSRNYISILLIVAASCYYIARQNTGKMLKIPDIIPALLCFLLSVWAEGRGGILASCILLAAMAVSLFLKIKNIRLRWMIIFLLVACGVMAVFTRFGTTIMNLFLSLGKWKSRGTGSDPRLVLWGAYFREISGNPLYLLFGAPLDSIPEIARFEGNCHNSFIQLHAYAGLVPFLLVISGIVRAGILYIRRKQWMMLAVLMTFCVRALTDKFVFGQYGMPLLLYFMLSPLIAEPSFGQNVPEKVSAQAETEKQPILE